MSYIEKKVFQFDLTLLFFIINFHLHSCYVENMFQHAYLLHVNPFFPNATIYASLKHNEAKRFFHISMGYIFPRRSGSSLNKILFVITITKGENSSSHWAKNRVAPCYYLGNAILNMDIC